MTFLELQLPDASSPSSAPPAAAGGGRIDFAMFARARRELQARIG
eukprot:SAG11_NODE_16092_length_557_cov_0.753275_1_plen_44_part_10